MSDMFDSLEAEMAGLRRELEAVKAERDALEAHVEQGRDAMMGGLRALGAVGCGESVQASALKRVLGETPATSMVRVKMLARAEAMEWAAEKAAPSVAPWLKALARDYRRQAGE